MKTRLMTAKKTIDGQVAEMDAMLTKLCDSRKRLMEQKGGRKGAEEGGGSGSEGEGGAVSGGMEALRERRRKRKEKGERGGGAVTMGRLREEGLENVASAGDREQLEQLWKATESASLKTGAAAEIATNDDGCPLYHKLLLDIEHPKDVTEQQRET